MSKLTRLFLAAFLFRFLLAFLVWHPDLNNHLDWGTRFFEYGPQQFYRGNVWNFTWPNQPPGTMYIFAGVRKLFEFVFSVFWWINVNVPPFPSGIITYFESNLYPALAKLPAILADLGIAYLIYKVLQSSSDKSRKGAQTTAWFAALLFLVNPVVWYNSSIWGQYDSVINFFGVLAFYFLLRKQLVGAVLAFALSLYIKASLAIFAPIFLIVALRQRYKISTYVLSVGITFLTILLLTLPFARGNPAIWLCELYKDKVFGQQLQVITANAFNIWATIAGIHERPHTLLFGPFSFKVWGQFLFGVTLLPVLYLVWKKRSVKVFAWSLAVVAFSSFMFLTNMHERYLYPLFPFLTMLVAIDKSMLPLYLGISGISFLNLYHFWWVPRFDALVNALSWKDRLAPRVLGLVNFGIFLVFYQHLLRLFKSAKI